MSFVELGMQSDLARANLFYERQSKKGIRKIFVDFDDTLVYTHRIFVKHIEEFITLVNFSRTSSREELEQFRQIVWQRNTEIFHTLGVRRDSGTD